MVGACCGEYLWVQPAVKYSNSIATVVTQNNSESKCALDEPESHWKSIIQCPGSYWQMSVETKRPIGFMYVYLCHSNGHSSILVILIFLPHAHILYTSSNTSLTSIFFFQYQGCFSLFSLDISYLIAITVFFIMLVLVIVQIVLSTYLCLRLSP